MPFPVLLDNLTFVIHCVSLPPTTPKEKGFLGRGRKAVSVCWDSEDASCGAWA